MARFAVCFRSSLATAKTGLRGWPSKVSGRIGHVVKSSILMFVKIKHGTNCAIVVPKRRQDILSNHRGIHRGVRGCPKRYEHDRSC